MVAPKPIHVQQWFTGQSGAAYLASLVCNHVNQGCARYMLAIMSHFFRKKQLVLTPNRDVQSLPGTFFPPIYGI